MNYTCRPKVIYGDTDSVFVKFPNLSVKEAYQASQELIRDVTASNPYPMELKFEKVYRPLINLAKKRYCGYKYETPDSKPEVESKGIETIRRDFLPIVSKIMNKVIHLLFIYNDLSLVKKYFENQWIKLHEGNIEAVDLFLQKEKEKDGFECFQLPAKSELIKTSQKQLTNVLNRIFHIFGIDISFWVKSMIERNTVNCIINARKNLGIMNKTNEFDSRFLIKLGYDKNTDFSKFTLSSPYLVLEDEFLFENELKKSTLGINKKSICLICYNQSDVHNYVHKS